jgi:hypothetical protein
MLRYIIGWECLGVLAFVAETVDTWRRLGGSYGPKIAAQQRALISGQGGEVLAQVFTLAVCLVMPPLALLMTALTIRASLKTRQREDQGDSNG